MSHCLPYRGGSLQTKHWGIPFPCLQIVPCTLSVTASAPKGNFHTLLPAPCKSSCPASTRLIKSNNTQFGHLRLPSLSTSRPKPQRQHNFQGSYLRGPEKSPKTKEVTRTPRDRRNLNLPFPAHSPHRPSVQLGGLVLPAPFIPVSHILRAAESDDIPSSRSPRLTECHNRPYPLGCRMLSYELVRRQPGSSNSHPLRPVLTLGPYPPPASS